MNWAEIAKAAQEAKGADWKLDNEILLATGGYIRAMGRIGLSGRTKGSVRWFPNGTTSTKGYAVPRPSASLDAIMGLVRAQDPRASYRIYGPHHVVAVQIQGYWGEAAGATAPLAAVAAFALAMDAQP